MVKERDKDTAKKRENQGKAERPAQAGKQGLLQHTVVAVSG